MEQEPYILRMEHLYRSLDRSLNARFKKNSINMERWTFYFLDIMRGRNSVPLGELGKYLGASRGTVSRHLGIMIRKGWVERNSNGADMRMADLRLTPEGEAAHQEALLVVQEWEKEVFGLLAPEQANSLLELMGKLAELVDQENDQARARRLNFIRLLASKLDSK